MLCAADGVRDGIIIADWFATAATLILGMFRKRSGLPVDDIGIYIPGGSVEIGDGVCHIIVSIVMYQALRTSFKFKAPESWDPTF